MVHEAAAAKLLLKANRELPGKEQVARPSAEIARAEGADPVTEYKRVYEANKSADTLRPPVSALIEKRNSMRSESMPRSSSPSPAIPTMLQLLPKPMPTQGTTTIWLL